MFLGALLMVTQFAVLCFEQLKLVQVHHFLLIRYEVYLDVASSLLKFFEKNGQYHLIGELSDIFDGVSQFYGDLS